MIHEPPDTAAVKHFIRSRALSVPEINCLHEIADAIDAANVEAGKAFSRAAGIVRPEVLIEFGDLYGLNEESVRFALSTTTKDWDAMKAMRRKSRNEAISEARANGKTQKQIAEEQGIAQQTVADVLAKPEAGNANNDQRAKLSEGDQQIIRDRAANGDSQKSIAADFGISQGKVSQVVNGKNGHESKPKAANSTPSTPSLPNDSTLHAPPFSLLHEEGHELNAEMRLNRKRYYDCMRFLFEDIARAGRRFKALQNILNDDYARNHGGMLARWHAYESCWADDFDELAMGARSYSALAEHAKAQLRTLSTVVDQSHEHLRRIKPQNITLHD